jgi:tRNA nucleotidyltransferase (CCA-adding enzyme)
MQTYLVGGAVRDALLGLPQTDRDWVVVGQTPEQMVANGFIPVGKDFPVFLHPQTKEEYALARTERKTSHGYHGFAFHASPDVTLEQDLARRDLTINAIAQTTTSTAPHGAAGALVDPFGGCADLQNRWLRHVSPAFAEDPVRILRVARLAAKLPAFNVAPETMQLMCDMVSQGEVAHLVAERVWQELSKGLMTDQPSRMLQVLRQCGALRILLPEVDALFGVPQRADYHPEVDTGIHLLMVLDQAARLQAPLSVRFACLCHDLGKATTPAHVLPKHIGHEMRSVKLLKPVCDRLKVPKDMRELAVLVAQEHGHVHQVAKLSAAARVRLLERCDAFRRPDRFAQALQACECDALGRGGVFSQQPYDQRAQWLGALQQAQSVDVGAIAKQVQQQGAPSAQMGERIAQAIHMQRVQALQDHLKASHEVAD